MKNFIFFFCLLALVVMISATEGAYFAPQGANFSSSHNTDDQQQDISIKNNLAQTPNIDLSFASIFLSPPVVSQFFRSPDFGDTSEKLTYIYDDGRMIFILFIRDMDKQGESRLMAVFIISHLV